MVIQSAAAPATAWLDRCMDSVVAWASYRGYGYQRSGDELFDLLPADCRQKLAGRGPILADLARLIWTQQLLGSDAIQRVIWLDADVLVFAPEHLELEQHSSCLFGYERWVQPVDSKLAAGVGFHCRTNVHNALTAFRSGCPILPFLIEVIQRMTRRVNPAHIAPQMMGPKLLSSLHNLAQFEVCEQVGALSPWVVAELAAEPGRAWQTLRQTMQQPLLAANLCASLVRPSTADESKLDKAETGKGKLGGPQLEATRLDASAVVDERQMMAAIDVLLTHRHGIPPVSAATADSE